MTSHALQIRVLERLEDLEPLRPEWERLLATLPTASIFSSWEWLAPWWRAFGDRQSLHVLSFQNSTARLAGIAPLAFAKSPSAGVQWKVARLMGDGSKDSDNLDLPVLPEYEEDFIEVLLRHLEENSQRWDFCEWNTVPENSPLARRLPALLEKRNWPLVTTFTACSAIALPDSWDSYVKELSAKERGKMGIRTRRLEKLYKVQYRRSSQVQDLERDLETLFALHQLRWEADGRPGTFISPARRQFYRDLATLLLSRNQLQLWFLQLDGKPVAAQFGFRFAHTVYSLQEGFDPSFANDSVGYVLRAHVLRILIAEGVRKYDFLGGVNDSKTRWGAQVSRYVNFQFARPRTAGSLYLRVKDELKKGKKSLRTRVSPRMWSFLHDLNVRLRGPKK
jgi:CelD/BcsL family acetyltransferase involved in cellulose biosynthesis